MLNIERTIEGMENVLLELGFKRGKIGEHEYLIYKDNYCKISLSLIHIYQVIGDFSNLEHYVEICPDRELAQEIQKHINLYYGGDYKNVVIYAGEIAGVKGWGSGGGMQ